MLPEEIPNIPANPTAQDSLPTQGNGMYHLVPQDYLAIFRQLPLSFLARTEQDFSAQMRPC